MKVIVDKELCIGCGVCIDICPDVFEMDAEDGKVKAKETPIPVKAEDDCRDAAAQCPVEAIQIEDA